MVCLNYEDELEVDERIANAPRDKLLVVRYTVGLTEMLGKAETDRRRAETTLPDPIDGPEWPVDVEDEREKKREKLDVSLLKLIGIKLALSTLLLAGARGAARTYTSGRSPDVVPVVTLAAAAAARAP